MPQFATPQPISATVDIVSGDVRVVAGERTDTVVTVSPRNPSSSRDVNAAEQVRVDYTDGKLNVKAPKPLHIFFGGWVGTIDVTVELPSGSAVRAHTYDGDLRCEGEVGDCWLKTADGDISVHRAAAIQLSTMNGDILVDRAGGHGNVTGSGVVRIQEITGNALVKNLNGDSWIGIAAGDVSFNSAHGGITIERPGGDVSARTAFGSIQVGRLSRGKASLQTMYGHLDIGIDKGVAAWLDVKSSSGRVRNDMQPVDRPEQGGTVEVRGRTAAGDIVVHHA
jgi:Putative adhesin